MFGAMDTVKDCLAIATGVIVTMKPNPEMLMKALSPEMLATDLADYLVRKGVPFRETHHIRYVRIEKYRIKHLYFQGISNVFYLIYILFQLKIKMQWCLCQTSRREKGQYRYSFA